MLKPHTAGLNLAVKLQASYINSVTLELPVYGMRIMEPSIRE
jgi:hypothetical protein